MTHAPEGRTGVSGLDESRRSKLPIHVLRYHDYRLLWGGQFVSTLGTQMHAAALSWQVYELTGSLAQLGLLGLVRAAALMSMSFIGGVTADARDRRMLLLVTQSVLLLFSASLALLTAIDAVNVVMLYVIAALVAATTAFDGPARQALIPALVPRNDLASAMSLNILAMSIARMAGPALGGVAVSQIGIASTYALDAATFVAVIGALLAMRTRVATPVMRASGKDAIVEGLRFIWMTPVVFGVMLLDFLATLLGSTIGLAPAFAEDILNVGASGYGLLLSAPAAGAVLGGFIISLIPPIRRPGRVVVVSVVVYGLFLVLFGLSPSFVFALAALAGAGAADAVSVAMRHTVRNLATPDELRGRVAASHSALAMGGPRLGEFQSGITGALIGPRLAMVAGGTACVLASLVVAWLVPVVIRYRIDDDVDEQTQDKTPATAASITRDSPGRALRSGESAGGQ